MLCFSQDIPEISSDARFWGFKGQSGGDETAQGWYRSWDGCGICRNEGL